MPQLWTYDQGLWRPPAGVAAFVGPLDSLPGTIAAYSLRRLLSSYAANKAVNNGSVDIGFTASGDFSGGSGTLSTWYDQSGNGNNVTIAAGEGGPGPTLTANDTNSKTGLRFISGNAMGTASAVSVPQPWTMNIVGARTNSFTTQQIAIGSNGTAFLGWSASANTIQVDGGTQGSVTDSTFHSVTYVGNGASSFISTDGVQTSNFNEVTALSATFLIGNVQAFFGSHFLGDLLEVLIFNSALTPGQIATLRANQRTYYGTP